MPRSRRSLLACALLLCAGALWASRPASSATSIYKVDSVHSALLWKIQHLGVSWTHGRFNEFTGTFTVDDENLKNAKVELDITASSIDSNSEKRDTHLRSKDFFDVETYPSIGFESTAVTKVDAKTYRVVGTFTMHGVSKEVVLRMTKVGEGKDPGGTARMGFEGAVTIKRSDYGMPYGLPAIGDEVHITLGVEGVRQ